MDAPRLRFAPSPSGYLHIGGARTALFCWLLARRHGGTFILRVEDTDASRSTDASIAAILDSMRWLGLDWDEGPIVDGPHAPYFQSQRGPVYQAAIQRLLGEGKLYRCICTQDELAAKREAALAANRNPIYDGTCREAGHGPDVGVPFVLRLVAPVDGETLVDDAIKGRVVFPNRELGDQVVVRSNGDPLYNFVVVLDDVAMGMTHVVRGDDHLSNTPKQVQLYEALGAPVPQFAHVPLILGPDKKRLSKRHGATSVMSYDDEGYLPEAMVNYLARLGWSHGDQEIFTVAELIDAFSLDHVGRSPGVWDPDKLLWVNAQHLAALDLADLTARVAPRIAAAGFPAQPVDDVLRARVATLRGRARLLTEFVTAGAFYWTDATELVHAVDDKGFKKWMKPSAAPILAAALEVMEGTLDWTAAGLEAALTPLLERFAIGMGKLAQPIRCSITGTPVSPGLFETLEALGKEQTLPRMRAGLAICAGKEQD
jgi:glutamyl-tRNA synthetase